MYASFSVTQDILIDRYNIGTYVIVQQIRSTYNVLYYDSMNGITMASNYPGCNNRKQTSQLN